jgi:hypothetical protein
VDGVVQEVSQVKQVQAALEALIRGSSTAPGLRPLKVPVSPKKKAVQKKKAPTPTKEAESQQILPVENVDSDSMYDWPPIKSVEDCWREMYEGLEGRPSLMSLEERYGSAWRRKKGQRQRFCEKKQVRGPTVLPLSSCTQRFLGTADVGPSLLLPLSSCAWRR